MTIRISAANGGTLSIDRLCEAVSGIDQDSRTIVLSALREMFPEIIWTRGCDGRIFAMVHSGYRP